MLPIKPETMQQMKARFGKAIAEPVDAEAVIKGVTSAPSSNRDHVFDFEDGMRLCVSVDRVLDTEFLHVSASGSDEYQQTIKGEGIKGMMEDVFLRLAAMWGRQPKQPSGVRMSNGVLHMMFERTNHD